MDNNDLTYRLAMSIGAALRHTHKVRAKHPAWTNSEILGCFVTSLRRAMAGTRSELEGSTLKGPSLESWVMVENLLCSVVKWNAPGYPKTAFAYSPFVDIEVALDLAHDVAIPNDFDRALMRLENIRQAASNELTQYAEYVSLANEAALDLVVDFSMILEEYPELTNG